MESSIKSKFLRNVSHKTSTKSSRPVIVWDRLGQCPVQYLETIVPAMEQSHWCILVIPFELT